MSAPFSPAALTRTRHSPAPATGSGWSSTLRLVSLIVTALMACSGGRRNLTFNLPPFVTIKPWTRCSASSSRGCRRRRLRRPWPPLQQRNALDVRRLGEHVHRPHAPQHITGLDQLGGVGRERRRVAGDVDDAGRRGLD